MKDFKIVEIAQIILAVGVSMFLVELGIGLISWFN